MNHAHPHFAILQQSYREGRYRQRVVTLLRLLMGQRGS